jgi:hypothetical protein
LNDASRTTGATGAPLSLKNITSALSGQKKFINGAMVAPNGTVAVIAQLIAVGHYLCQYYK